MKLPWMKSAFACLLLGFTMGHGQSQPAQMEKFHYQRAIVPGGPGPNRLEIDVALLAAASPFRELVRASAGMDQEPVFIGKAGLSDLRIFDSANHEVPYLLVAPATPEPRWSEGRLLPVAATKKTSGFEADLGQSLRVNGVRLAGIAAPFLKRVQLEGSGDRSRWTMLVEEGTIFDLPAENLKRLELEFDPGEYRYLRITWDDTASARIPLPRSISARMVSAGTLPPPLRAPLQFERRAGEPGVSRYRLHLPGPHLPVVAIELASAGGNVLRRARVNESRLSGDEMVPQMLGLATLWHTVRGSATEAELRIPITAPQEAQLELTIYDGDNPPLDLTGISAVFAHLPWIYFENPDNKPLTARFGYADLAAPQYDLEAVRDSIAKLRTAKAQWGELREEKPAVESLTSASVPLAGAPIDVGTFRYSREIPPGNPGLNALLLDAEVLAHSRMSDLRIAAADGRQIPYLMEKLDGPLTVNLPALEKMQAPGPHAAGSRPTSGAQSYYRLRLPYEHLPASRLVLKTSARVFRREVSILIEKNPSNERQEPWTNRIAAATWSRSDPEAQAPPLIIPLPSLATADARLVIEEGDNSPLPIEPISLLLPSYQMRFFRENTAGLKLYYGNSSLEAPRYDLSLLAPRLSGAAAEEISLSPENSASSERTQAHSLQTIIFWAILGLAVVVLLVLIARLVKKSEAGGSN